MACCQEPGKKISLKKPNQVLLQWNSHIVNHFWHCCKTATSYTQFVGMWIGVLHHIINEHEWVLPHGNDDSFECSHGPLNENERDKEWLHPANNSTTIRDLANIVMDKRLFNNVHYYLNFRSTAELESFHQHILMYCAKRYSYIPPVYRARNLLAALDHNIHAERPLHYKKDGTERLKRVYNKKSGRWPVYQQKIPKTYSYVQDILQETLTVRLEDKVGMCRPRVLDQSDARRISPYLAPKPPRPSKELFAEQITRYKK